MPAASTPASSRCARHGGGADASLLRTALGLCIGLSSVFASRQQALLQPLAEGSLPAIDDLIATLRKAVIQELAAQGIGEDAVSSKPVLQIRYDGTDTALPVNFEHGSIARARIDFEAAHKGQFGFVYEDKPMIVESVGVEGTDTGGGGRDESESETEDLVVSHSETRKIFAEGEWRDTGVFRREALKPGTRVSGPALIIEPNQTIVVEPGWQAEITARNHVLLRRIEKKRRQAALGTAADPVMLEVFNNLFMSIAEQMGVTLQNTAYSVNIKERLDFSCAVFDRHGALVANAPHMPVHLGSMDRSVETIIRLNSGDIHPGDVFALNAPYNGGTHLPDITVVTPVFDDAKKESCSGRPRAATMPTSAVPLPADDAARYNGRRGRRPVRQFPHRRSRKIPRDRVGNAAHRPPLPGPQSAPEHRRPQGADRRQ
ncbi:hypothetical protein AJ88_36850 [Mesorhizobium amorphae CCBAU 01583]|nr:hypothetical protein AJ88_36850 [Mesorhizobium amorphae CCBAU 01583]